MVTENVFRGGHLEFSNLSGNRLSDVVVPAFLKSAYPKNPKGKVSCFLHKVHANFIKPLHYLSRYVNDTSSQLREIILFKANYTK